MKSRTIFTLLPLLLAIISFIPVAHATTHNGVTCKLFVSVANGAINWPINGNLYYCGDTPTADAAGVSEVWNAAGQATERTVGSQTVPYLRKAFTDTGVELFVFDTIQDFDKYFDYTLTPPKGATLDDIAGFTARPGEIPNHPGPFSAIFQYSPAIVNSPQRLLLIVQTTNHELGHEMDRFYLYPSGASEPSIKASQNWLTAVNLDIDFINNMPCIDVFGGLSGLGVNWQKVCSQGSTNWGRMRSLWPFDTSPAEFFANVFAAYSPGGAVNEALGAIIYNDFLHTIEYEVELETGTGKP